ncbi:hypothetical protein ADUPG1_013808 [Aduncisulcus paluster]|uniref:Uncharacterized protein n=1 Tax=Aduncisulcus paluster TaxID=2918883 RepID=A0ABQ5K923_9EUKA|nr:hypothetical protein ADUPG1_013808 [Aduncisulcus paluster]
MKMIVEPPFEGNLSILQQIIQFFAYLCASVPLKQAIEIYETIEPFMDKWFDNIFKDPYPYATKISAITELISAFVVLPPLLSRISPKYDETMEKYKGNTGSEAHYAIYLKKTNPNKGKWLDIIREIKDCRTSSELTKQYLKHRKSLVSFFNHNDKKEQIVSHKSEALQVFQCLSRFVCNYDADDEDRFLEPDDFSELIETFFNPMIIVLSSVDNDIEFAKLFVKMCYHYLAFGEDPTFFPKVLPILKRLLGLPHFRTTSSNYIKESLEILSEESETTAMQREIFDAIKPFLESQLSSDKFEYWEISMVANLTWSNETRAPIPQTCTESWPFFLPSLAYAKAQYAKPGLIKHQQPYIYFFANLCCDQDRAVEVYKNIADQIEVWFKNVEKYIDGHICVDHMLHLLSSLSRTPSLIPQISPKFDDHMKWCNANIYRYFDHYVIDPHTLYTQYIDRCRNPESKMGVEGLIEEEK